MQNEIRRLLKYAWAAPCSAVGLALGAITDCP